MVEEVDQSQEQYKKLHFRMYESKYPKENELVYVRLIIFITLINK